MEEFKLTKRLMRDAVTLLKGVGAVVGTKAYPSHVYLNVNDYKKLYKNVRNQFEKEYPHLSAKKIQVGTGMHMLNLGPCALKGVKEGYVLVDLNRINDDNNEK